ncbi:MAG: hypothetical protein LKI25_05875 [Atopobiaceae bacterium]|jgi:flavodoxin|nr:hypothetical protein [Atopobiaceae bacterium]MCI2173724.1 hypothetical protein [Atopobiaceae bacterium]MCI2207634.1 hypothetical protein [Atopobiaceae bacterium]
MKIAVVCYSLTGNSRYAAERIAEGLKADLYPLEPVRPLDPASPMRYVRGGASALLSILPRLKPYDYRSENYDYTVLVFPIWAGRPAAPMLSFVSENTFPPDTVSLVMCSKSGHVRGCMRKLGRYIVGVKKEPGLNLVEPVDASEGTNASALIAYPKELKEHIKQAEKARRSAKAR